MIMHTYTDIQTLRAAVRQIAERLGCSPDQAWEAAALPAWVYAEATAAANAAGPAPDQDQADFMDLLAPDTAEREAASAEAIAKIRAEVLAP